MFPKLQIFTLASNMAECAASFQFGEKHKVSESVTAHELNERMTADTEVKLIMVIS